jgi:hypothetical protein
VKLASKQNTWHLGFSGAQFAECLPAWVHWENNMSNCFYVVEWNFVHGYKDCWATLPK